MFLFFNITVPVGTVMLKTVILISVKIHKKSPPVGGVQNF